ncbi:lactate utilization protein [Azospirillum sp. RWY-5-1]|uniref:Lactate utilization protein n=1 Tax=Azospirillum oleiclasticum TaxID=2735135 RepID=A0ABX2T7J8_9PROT|nr:lactate utilization protein [Azospirillum oleiclasticum]NYZ11489.1 lactate utilization protein [Azospirillum oleiclasticum]NYZ18650.1 lactate utilization protein [Azospirillum oleiclasticum]
MSDARTSILTRLRASRDAHPVTVPPSDFGVLAGMRWSPEERLDRLRTMMEAVHTEFLDATEADWPAVVRDFLRAEGVKTLLHGTPIAAALAAAWTPGAPERIAYDQPVEGFKERLFTGIDAGITTTLGGIAHTGSLILWPTPEEPRLMSLVPPVHVALLRADRLYDTFWQAMTENRWSQGMPTNALLVSGPSKTADIEQTLAYGVHGPKRLIVVVVRV